MDFDDNDIEQPFSLAEAELLDDYEEEITGCRFGEPEKCTFANHPDCRGYIIDDV